MSTIHDLNTRKFLRNLAKQDNSYFVTPWAGVILRNSDIDGHLIEHTTIQSYIKSKTQYWIYLKLKIFRDEEGIYGAFICPTCQSMSTVMMMSMDQRRGDIENTLCLHSVAAVFHTDWREIWGLPNIDDEILSHKFQPGLDTKILVLLEDDLTLVAVQSEGDVKLLFTLSKKNKAPFCSKCSTQKCKHFKQYTDFKKQNLNDSNHSNVSDSNASGQSGEEDEQSPISHYDDIEPLDEYNKKFGYNLTRIVYPFKMDPETQGSWKRRLEGHYDLPDKIIPEFIEGFSCPRHGNTYDPDDKNLLQYSSNIIIYTEICEKVYNIKTYARPTIGEVDVDNHQILINYCFGT